jgi:hypothetical protein
MRITFSRAAAAAVGFMLPFVRPTQSTRPDDSAAAT